MYFTEMGGQFEPNCDYWVMAIKKINSRHLGRALGKNNKITSCAQNSLII